MQNLKSTPDNLKQIFQTFGRKPSLGAPDVRRGAEVRMRLLRGTQKQMIKSFHLSSLTVI